MPLKQMRIGQRALDRVILAAQRRRERGSAGIHHLETAGIVRAAAPASPRTT